MKVFIFYLITALVGYAFASSEFPLETQAYYPVLALLVVGSFHFYGRVWSKLMRYSHDYEYMFRTDEKAEALYEGLKAMKLWEWVLLVVLTIGGAVSFYFSFFYMMIAVAVETYFAPLPGVIHGYLFYGFFMVIYPMLSGYVVFRCIRYYKQMRRCHYMYVNS